MQPTDLRPVLHGQHPWFLLTSREARRSEGVRFQPSLGGQFSRVADTMPPSAPTRDHAAERANARPCRRARQRATMPPSAPTRDHAAERANARPCRRARQRATMPPSAPTRDHAALRSSEPTARRAVRPTTEGSGARGRGARHTHTPNPGVSVLPRSAKRRVPSLEVGTLGRMGKKHQRATFADVVRGLEQEARTPPPPRPGLHGPTQLVDREGRTYAAVEAVSAKRAQELAQAGAAIVYDPCGCRGYCGLTWFDPEDVHRMVAAGPPTIGRRRGCITEWRAEGGEIYLLVEDDVKWGDVLD